MFFFNVNLLYTWVLATVFYMNSAVEFSSRVVMWSKNLFNFRAAWTQDIN